MQLFLHTVSSCFTGGFARVGMKAIATQLNLYVPGDVRAQYPFLVSFAGELGWLRRKK
jgi:hypothetical protein